MDADLEKRRMATIAEHAEKIEKRKNNHQRPMPEASCFGQLF
jgi:hypothetical protein